MKKALSFILALGLSLCSVSYSFALSDADYKKYKQQSVKFAIADKDLSQTWKMIKGMNGGKIPGALMAEQKQWIQVDRDTEAQKLFNTMSPADAYAEVTNQRIEILRTKWLMGSPSTGTPAQQPIKTNDTAQDNEDLGFQIPTVGKKYTILTRLKKYDDRIVTLDQERAHIDISQLKNATNEFRTCIDDGNYKGMVRITSVIGGVSAQGLVNFKIDKTSICERHGQDIKNEQDTSKPYALKGKLEIFDAFIVLNDIKLNRKVVVAYTLGAASSEISPSLSDCVYDLNTNSYNGNVVITGNDGIIDRGDGLLRIDPLSATCKRSN
ncbi:hypothetical protein LJC09_01595 [Desulfovibrio sp. OttesenSCG-928-F20]|nr:hypothetical protein [Desulfovibrio sp. OttesenSCG-928-F20]